MDSMTMTVLSIRDTFFRNFSSPGDHRRSLSIKSFRFPPENLDKEGTKGDEHAFQVSKDDLFRRKQLFESVHST